MSRLARSVTHLRQRATVTWPDLNWTDLCGGRGCCVVVVCVWLGSGCCLRLLAVSSPSLVSSGGGAGGRWRHHFPLVSALGPPNCCSLCVNTTHKTNLHVHVTTDMIQFSQCCACISIFRRVFQRKKVFLFMKKDHSNYYIVFNTD